MEIDIQQYTCYRKYLSDFYTHKKSLRQSFSFRQFSAKAGIRSPNYLQLVMKGERNLTDDTAPRVAKAMGLTGAQKDYFLALVARDRAENSEQKAMAERQFLRAVKRLVAQQIPQAQSQILAHWYHLVIRELVFLPDFDSAPAWISRKLRGLVTESEAAAAWKLLIDSGFVVAKGEGRYAPADPVLQTGDSFNFARVLSYHQQTLRTWCVLLESLRAEERSLGLLNIPISSAKIPELAVRMKAFREEIIGWLKDEVEPDQIVQLGTYLLPISIKE